MNKKAKIVNTAVAGSIYIAGVIACAVFLYIQREEKLLAYYDKIIKGAAKTIPLIIPPDFPAKSVKIVDSGRGADIKTTGALTALADNFNVSCLYTVIRKNGRFYVPSFSSPHLKSEPMALPEKLTEYKSVPEKLKRMFVQKRIIFDEYTDNWGRFRSVYIPVRGAGGVFYAACADIKLDDIELNLYPIMMQSVFIALLFLLLAYPLIWTFTNINRSQSGELMEKKKQLAHAGRLTSMGEMAAGIAHEINQPLCVIRGYLELLKSVLKNNSEIKEKQLENAFDIGITSVEKISKIINHMRTYARVKNKEAEPTRLTEPLESALSFFNEQIKLHNIKLDKEYEDELPLVNIDRQRFEQVAVNFISNARYAVDLKEEQAGPEYKKKITLKLRSTKSKNQVIMEVSDNGAAMSNETLMRCRDPFYTTKNPEEGTGLGIPIAEDIINDYGGKLRISSGKGHGTTIQVVLPACS
jgi:signal transduction histidine kinase